MMISMAMDIAINLYMEKYGFEWIKQSPIVFKEEYDSSFVEDLIQ